MTSLPDWLVERAALDEVPPASRDRIERADPRELAERVAALQDDNTAELARHPAGPAVAEIEARLAAETRRRTARNRRRLTLLGLAAGTSAAVLLAQFALVRPAPPDASLDDHAAGVPDEITRTKGAPRLVAFRRAGEQSEMLAQDAVVHAGDVIQLRYKADRQGFGVIASLDGAGVVTLHFPPSEDAPPQATAVSPEITTLPHAYALDDAPRFERFFFITADDPVDVQQALGALRTLAHRDDSATAALELPAGLRQSSLRLRKPDRSSSSSSSNHESP